MGKEEYSIKNTQQRKARNDLSGLLSGITWGQPATLVFDSPDLRHGFTQVPTCILKDVRLSSNDKVLYALLLSYAWQTGRCFPGQSMLAANMGSSERLVRRCMSKLKRHKFISIERRGLGKVNIYHIRKLSDAYPQIVDKGDRG